MYRRFLRPLLFRLSPELAHHFTFQLMRAAHRLPGWKFFCRRFFAAPASAKGLEVAGLQFPNRVGLAAGFDKDGLAFSELASYGFGFLELGTVTPRSQPGNPRPRLFRLPADQGLINRMGFNNQGVDALAQRLQNGDRRGLIIGGNIGKNKSTPNEKALNDYRIAMARLQPWVDYFVINVSSPNTPDLRELQEKAPLQKLLQSLVQERASYQQARPIFLKIAPDLNQPQLDDILEIVQITGIDGIIATNTTIQRNELVTQPDRVKAMGAGGLSGQPLRKRSTEVIRYLHQQSQGQIPIIGVGGIFTAQDAREKIEAGASLVQVYTGFIYEGPAMVRRILQGLD